ncbi:MAG TPA: hypothetical protein PLW13_16565, partial [Pseudomonadales bacterium]|nr:hypothetical protein [Pseudomonadales bacterium]
RDDAGFLKHTLATYAGADAPVIDHGAVKITRLAPAVRAYGAAAEQSEAAQAAASPRGHAG